MGTSCIISEAAGFINICQCIKPQKRHETKLFVYVIKVVEGQWAHTLWQYYTHVVSCVLYETVWDISKILAQDQWHLNSIADSRNEDKLKCVTWYLCVCGFFVVFVCLFLVLVLLFLVLWRVCIVLLQGMLNIFELGWWKHAECDCSVIFTSIMYRGWLLASTVKCNVYKFRLFISFLAYSYCTCLLLILVFNQNDVLTAVMMIKISVHVNVDTKA